MRHVWRRVEVVVMDDAPSSAQPPSGGAAAKTLTSGASLRHFQICSNVPLKENVSNPHNVRRVVLDPAIDNAAVRALERCAVCASCFPARASGPKRREHLEACASFRGVDADVLVERVKSEIAHALRAERTRVVREQDERTLLAQVHGAPLPLSARWMRVARVYGMHPASLHLVSADDGHRAAHATYRAILSRLCVPAAMPRLPQRRQRQRARMYDAAHYSSGLSRLLRELDVPYAPCSRRRRELPPPQRRLAGVVPTSDEEEDKVPTYTSLTEKSRLALA